MHKWVGPHSTRNSKLFFIQSGEHKSKMFACRLKTSVRQIILKKLRRQTFCLVKMVKIFLGVICFERGFQIILLWKRVKRSWTFFIHQKLKSLDFLKRVLSFFFLLCAPSPNPLCYDLLANPKNGPYNGPVLIMVQKTDTQLTFNWKSEKVRESVW